MFDYRYMVTTFNLNNLIPKLLSQIYMQHFEQARNCRREFSKVHGTRRDVPRIYISIEHWCVTHLSLNKDYS